MVIAYLMKYQNYTLKDAYNHVKSKRAIIAPSIPLSIILFFPVTMRGKVVGLQTQNICCNGFVDYKYILDSGHS